MTASTYRINSPIMAVMMNRDRLIQLPIGSMIYAGSLTPDANGMIDGICNGEVVMVYSRDLEERAERIEELPVGAGGS